MTELTPLRRTDARLEPHKLQGFVTSCVTQGDCLADVFLGTRIYLERDGRITLEFLPDGGTLHFTTFGHDEWSPAETASADALRLFKRFRRIPDRAEVYDIFTGKRLREDELRARQNGVTRSAQRWDERLAF
ncbi:hypothetical protein [Pseudodesulfovibrio methanolicus]|uniref:Uncharacterized protein n=1 Tax=Pseudodesulfovibrio methanolicus TaxID=3126690 RepID=A0ABZ2ITP9_9BACT